MVGVIIVKLGGSVITEKSRPFSYRQDVASALAEEIASSDQDVVLVHGGGSFGHTVAKQYELSSFSYSNNLEAVYKTRQAMYELNALLCKTLSEAGLSPYTFSPFDLIMYAKRNSAKLWLNSVIRHGMVPVTFGDVISYKRGFKIISGDTIMYELAKILRPRRCVFALDVDGVFEYDTKVIIPVISKDKVKRVKVSDSEDATGGMKFKIGIASKIASLGCEVCFVSGYRRNEFAKALKGMEFYGTLIK